MGTQKRLNPTFVKTDNSYNLCPGAENGSPQPQLKNLHIMENFNYPPIGRYINLMFDRGFKRVFGKPANKDILIAFLNEVIPEKHIVDLTYLNTEKEGLGPESHKSVFDVQCSIDDGSRIIVEVQNADQKFYLDRVLYYGSLPILDQPDCGGEYALMPVYVISILDFSLEHERWNGDVRSSYSIREDGTGELMSDALHFIFLELGRFNKKVTELANDKEKWYYCIRHMDRLTERPKPMQAEIFRRLFNVSEVEALPKQEREQYIREMNTERDIRNQKAFAHEQGLAQGIAQGLAEGEAKGKAEGKAESQREIAKNLAALGIAPATIAKATGLSEDEVRKL